MKQWTFGKRMAVGFGAIILIVLILGALSALLMNQGSRSATILSRDYAHALDLVADFNQHVNDMRINVTPYVMDGSPERLQALREAITQLDESGRKLSDHLKSSPTLAGPDQLLTPALAKVRQYEQNVQTTIQAMEVYKETREKAALLGPKWHEATENLYARQYQRSQEMLKNKPTPEQTQQALHFLALTAEVRVDSLGIRLANTRGQAYRDIKMFQAADSNFKKLEATLAELETQLKQPEDVQALADVRSCLAEYQKGFTLLISSFSAVDESTKNRNILAKELKVASSKLYENILDLTIDSTNHTAAQLNFGQIFVTSGVAVAFVVACLLSLTLTRSISGLLKRIIDRLSAGAVETAAAAEQLSTDSQTLAQGASEQAASLEQTSSSLEEMTSMTKRNAENALNAKSLAQHARESAEKAAQDIASMSDGMRAVAASSEELSRAMNQIKTSSSAITQIMKTIDEIAFQTNILSINAAVEAARAGESGSGFAVVADEVRALAHRSAGAAKETAKLIEASSDSSARGVTVTEKVAGDLERMNQKASQVNTSLQSIVEQVRQVDNVIAEISTACQEQNQGIGQINIALTQMDKITQSTAASAEESASAAEEVSAQAEEAKLAVNQLQALVGQPQYAEVQPQPPSRSAAPPRSLPRKPLIHNTRHPHPLPARGTTPKKNEVRRSPADGLHQAMDEQFKDL
ncbi:MAG: hypothetical protein B9S32_15525 [Verrucomicrobia bacterium Tous-C9LFEB]|nr:MAG: hypothetical protein B9S32_15525 [Verrucomicrobia bacterium Tous-C9LFEB]